jgi:hypothetical protein
MSGNPLLHRRFDVLSIELAHDEIGITYPYIHKQIEDCDFQFICYEVISMAFDVTPCLPGVSRDVGGGLSTDSLPTTLRIGR